MQGVKDRILVVDADASDRLALSRALHAEQIHCDSAPDVTQALACLAKQAYDFVVVDPTRQKGLESFFHEARRRGARVVCAETSIEDRRRWRDSYGAESFVPKPWPSVEELLTLLHRDHEWPGTDDRQLQPEEEIRYLRNKNQLLEEKARGHALALQQAQESFYQDVSRMMSIVSSIMDGIVFVDLETGVKLMNPAAEDLLGIKSFMAIGKPLADLPGGSELLDAMKEDAAKLDWRESSRIVEVHHFEQDLLYIKLRVSQVLDYRGENAGTLIVLQDVTAEHKTDQLKNQYLSIVAHELRTPLTGIKTFSTLMSKGALGPLNERQDRVIESIREQSLRLEHQIDKLINLGHIESNEYGQDLEVFDARELMQQVADPFEQPAKDRGIRIHVTTLDAANEIEGDRADLKRALMTLVENAVKFCSDGGQVWVSATVDGDRVRFAVKDDGPGIDPRYHRRIFEKFFQVEDPLTRHHGGAGLGLFFVDRIVRAHGTGVTVDSRLGAGATFWFSLPIRKPQEAEVASTGGGGTTDAAPRS